MKRDYPLKIALLSIFILPLFISCSNFNKTKNYTITTKDVDKYETINKKTNMQLTFIDDVKSIPYLSTSEVVKLLLSYFKLNFFTIVRDNKNQIATITKNKDQSKMIIDCRQDKIVFKKYNLFVAPDGQDVDLDFITDTKKPENNNKVIKKVDKTTSYHQGNDSLIDCKAYHIDLVWANNDAFIPLQIMNDFIISQPIVYNGEFLIQYTFDNYNDAQIDEMIYKHKGKKRDDKLIEFNYNSLCMYYDYVYSLKDKHQINKLDDFLTNNNRKEAFLSSDAKISSLALQHFINDDLDDLHSKFRKPSVYSLELSEEEKQNNGITNQYMTSNKIKLINSFKEYLPNDDVNTHFYKESGDTAFIYLPSFEYDDTINYYDTKYIPSESNTWFKEKNDTIGLIQHAHKRITSNTNIKKIVLDLSTNTGGEINPALYTISWMMGFPVTNLSGVFKEVMPGYLHVRDTNTNSTYTSGYLIDTNLDHQFNELDVLGNYDVDCYCLISKASFSASNYVATMFKGHDRVTLIGQETGGGSCNVRLSTTADGTLFQMSDRYQLCTYKNGSFTPNELGTDPDVYIKDITKFYAPSIKENETIYRGFIIDFINSIK